MTTTSTTSSTDPAADLDVSLAGRLADYRTTREAIERNILPLATSVDGHGFELQTSLYGLAIARGSYVAFEGEGDTRFGQVTELSATAVEANDSSAGGGINVRLQLAVGRGTLLAPGPPFHNARVRPATPEEVDAWAATSRPAERAGLEIGQLLHASGVTATLDAGGLNRHTFMCGQSGSGKTYSLGLLLERVLAETTIRIVILDPNSDFVGLREVREGVSGPLATRYASVAGDVAVWGDGPSAEHPLKLRFADLDHATQAATLGLDPIADREEYAVLAELVRNRQGGGLALTSADQLLADPTPGARDLGLRASNLGVFDWNIWGPDQPSLVDELRSPTSRVTVVDLGSLGSVPEQRVVSQAVLATMWDDRFARTPVLLVIDEAHNICPAQPSDALTAMSTERTVQVAAEGRKFGLHLLVSTQRPNKVPENVVSQCDNLLLMRMNSRADLADLSRLFSFVPEGLMEGATTFRMGEALVAGKIMPQPAYVRMGERVSEEGGSDVATTWAMARTEG